MSALGNRVHADALFGQDPDRRTERSLEVLVHSMHEIRNAVSSASLVLSHCDRGMRDAGRSNDDTDALRAQLERIEWALEEIDELIGADGDWQNGATSEARIPVRLDRLVERRMGAWRRLAAAAGATMRIDRLASGTVVNGNARQLCQALDNLVSNALRHGGGRIIVASRICGDRVQISVADGGPGVKIPIERVAPVRGRGRHGHGLAIVRCAVEAAGGRVRSTPHAVVVELPLAQGVGRQLPTAA